MEQQAPLTASTILSQIRGFRAEAAKTSGLKDGYRLAAAVLAAIGEPNLLRPLSGPFEPGVGQKLLRHELVPAPGRIQGLVMLQHDARRAALRMLGSPERMLEAIGANQQQRAGSVQRQFENYLEGTAKPLKDQTSNELDATLQVLIWLQDIVGGLPDPQDVRTLVAWRDFMGPFETLAGDNVFRGRKRELEELRSFVGVLPPATLLEQLRRVVKWATLSAQPALSVYGPGGVGKSALIARFVLEHSRLPDELRIPFAYLDFDRPTLNVAEPGTLVDEMLRQLTLQFPAFTEFPNIRRSFAETAVRAGDMTSDPGSGEESRWLSVETAFVDLLNVIAVRLPSRPYLLVLDTFEQVQYRGERQALSLWRLFGTLQQASPFLRIVVSGRAPVSTLRLADKLPTYLEVSDLDDESAVAFVMQVGVRSKKTAETLVRQVGGVPLSLKLAATLLAKQPEADINVRSRIWLRTADEVIQGQLFDRILGQITDGELQRLAHPGLVLRRITPELILHVLREPCQLTISTLAEAGDLFEKLRDEVSLVSSDDPEGALVHRRELREVMLKLLKDRSPALVDDISQRAVVYYRGQLGRRARMEETYHELLLRRPIDKAVFDDSDVRASIQASIAELPLASQTLLAAYGFHVDQRILREATKEQQEAAAAEEIEELLAHGPEGLAEARHRLENYDSLDYDSPLWRGRARVHFEAGETEPAASALESGLQLAIAAGNSFRVLELLSDKAWQCEQAPWPAELDETLERLSDYAARHNDAAARVQHFLQHRRVHEGQAAFELKDAPAAAVMRMFQQLRPRDFFGLMPATRAFWLAAADSSLNGRVFAELIVDSQSTFGTVNFERSRAHRTLQKVVQNAYGFLSTEPESANWHGLATSLEELVTLWPYRNLHLHPPQSLGTAAV